jgi:AcrR family transcriptional regulator
MIEDVMMPTKTDAQNNARGKGRPRCFDRDKALLDALKLFWIRGYEPASISELCKIMGINAPSLYASFGNKAKLFLEAATYYEKTYWEAPARKLIAEPDIYKAIEGFFQDSARILLSPDTPCGCMVVLAAVNISDDAKEITDAIRVLRFATKEMFASRLRRAIKDRQIPKNTDVVSMAGALNTMLEGLSIQARDGLSQTELESIAHYAMRILP